MLPQDMNNGEQQPDPGVQRAEASLSHEDFADVYLDGLIVRLCAAITGRVPVRYEDETGFHFGMESASN
jgi:hypothetical protein